MFGPLVDTRCIPVRYLDADKYAHDNDDGVERDRRPALALHMHIGSETYDPDLSDIFQVQAGISAAIFEAPAKGLWRPPYHGGFPQVCRAVGGDDFECGTSQ